MKKLMLLSIVCLVGFGCAHRSPVAVYDDNRFDRAQEYREADGSVLYDDYRHDGEKSWTYVGFKMDVLLDSLTYLFTDQYEMREYYVIEERPSLGVLAQNGLTVEQIAGDALAMAAIIVPGDLPNLEVLEAVESSNIPFAYKQAVREKLKFSEKVQKELQREQEEGGGLKLGQIATGFGVGGFGGYALRKEAEEDADDGQGGTGMTSGSSSPTVIGNNNTVEVRVDESVSE